MFIIFIEDIMQVFTMNGLNELNISIHPGLIVCILFTVIFVHFIVKLFVNMFNKQQFTILLTYLINSLMIITLVMYLVYIVDDFILLKYGLKLVIIYGLCTTLLSLVLTFKGKKGSV